MKLSRHASEQMSRRRIRPRQIQLALEHGLELHRAGAELFVLRAKDLPAPLRADPDAARAEGTTVVVRDGVVLTLYRNRDVRHLRRKPYWDARPETAARRARRCG